MTPQDIEKLKKPAPIFDHDKMTEYRKGHMRGEQMGWNDCIDRLAAQGLLISEGEVKLIKTAVDDVLIYEDIQTSLAMRLRNASEILKRMGGRDE